jgi:hypothetical protein
VPDVGSRPSTDAGEVAPKLTRWSWLVFAVVAFVVASRKLYIAPDDANYIVYFGGSSTDGGEGIWLRVLDEPLWKAYAAAAGGYLGAEIAFRVTLALGVLGFLYGGASLARGGWPLVLMGFVVDPFLATQQYFNQIRQGLALSVFLTVAWIGRRRPRTAIWVGAGIAALIHSSFLFVLLCAVAALSLRRRALGISLAVLGSLAALLVLDLTGWGIDTVDLGRRSYYSFESSVNPTFFFVVVPQYVVILLLSKPAVDDISGSRWYDLTVALFAVTIAASIAFEAGPRLLYLCSAFMLIILGNGIQKPRVKMVTVMWFATLLLGAFLEGRKLGFNEDSWIGRWSAILTH